MGKYGGRVLTAFITQDGVRVCEGENKNGNLDITKFFTVQGVSEYFSQVGGGNPPEIINISGLVSAIVEECKNRRVSARRVMVCSDCFGISTEITNDTSIGGLKNLLTGDLKTLRSQAKSKDKSTPLPDQMVCKQSWGELTVDGAVKKISTQTVGDKYMLKSLVQEFYAQGYEVIFVSGAQEVLLNFRQTEPANFDSQGKVIFDYDVFCGVSVLVKDIPVEITHLAMIEHDQITERLHSQLNQALQKTGRNPRIYLAGSVFKDTQLYGQIIDELENDGYVVYDLFNRPEIDSTYESKLAMGEIEPVMTPDYSANIAMLMCAFTKTLITMTPAVDLTDTFKKNSKAIATLVLGVGALCLVASSVLAGIRFYNMMQMKANPSNVMNLQNQVTNLQSRQTSLNSTIQTLTEADTTVLELMRFIDNNQTDRVAVVSMDTRDMLGDSMSVDSSGVTVTSPTTTPTTGAAVDPNTVGTTPPDTTVSGSAGGMGTTRESIVIRGYAKTGNEAVAYFDRLFRHGLPVDPVLNGVERYTLPGGEEVYVFEIEIGGGTL